MCYTVYNEKMAFDLIKRIEALRKDLRELGKQREFIDMQMVNTNLALHSLARGMVDEKQREKVLREVAAARRKPGLTETIADALRRMPHSELSAKEISTWLERMGVDLSGYSQPLTTISITLRRMAQDGRLKVARKGRNVTYQWNGD